MTMKSPKTKLDWQAAETRLGKARQAAEDIVRAMKLAAPIDPFAVALDEHPMLKCKGGDFRNRFDGQLEYHPAHRRFILFYNTKYDVGLPAGEHHPRTRFSVSHELGHYFLDRHRAYFLGGGKSHASRGEFLLDVAMERDADAFASALLLPSALVRPLVNQEDLSLAVVEDIARDYQTSLVSTAIRAVQLSDFPCAVVGLREGTVAWSSRSQALIDAGLYPPQKGSTGSPSARQRWERFQSGTATKDHASAFSRHWFRSFDRDDLAAVPVTEHYLPVPTMETLIVLLSVPEDEILQVDGDQDSDED